MSFFSDIKTIERSDSYFAAANTKDGFRSCFKEVFGKIPKIYVIKGGPGTGKSTLMSKIASEGQNRGFKVTKYYCSSDTNSLDGVVVGENFAVIDGTSPHTFEPRNVGAIDVIINLCDMWNDGILIEKQKDICFLTESISQKYSRVYSLLNAMSTIESEYLVVLKKHVNQEKLKKFTDKIASTADRSANVSVNICDAIGVQGYVHLTTIENQADKTVYIKNKHHEGTVFLQFLKESLDSFGADHQVSLSPVNMLPTAVTVNGTAFICTDSVPDGVKALNMTRFFLPSVKNEKKRQKSIYKICSELSVLVCSELADIGELHDKLEKIYKSAMNYDKLDLFTKKLLIKMFC